MSNIYDNFYDLLKHLEDMKDGSGETFSVPKAIYCLAKEIEALKIKTFSYEGFCRICKNETVACVCMGEDEAQKQFNQALKSWKQPIRDKNE